MIYSVKMALLQVDLLPTINYNHTRWDMGFIRQSGASPDATLR